MRGVGVVGGQRVPVGNEKETVVLILHTNPVLERADIVAEMELAGRAHSAQDAFLGGSGHLEFAQHHDIEANKRADQAAQKPSAQVDEREQREKADAVEDQACRLGQKMAKDVAPVERRDRNQVEHREHYVDDHQLVEQHGDRSKRRVGELARITALNTIDYRLASRRREGDATENEERTGRNDEIADGAGDGSENVVERRIAKITRVDRSRLGPAKQGNSADSRNEGQNNCAEQIDMANWIQRDAAQHASCLISTAGSGPGVRGFVHADGEQERDHLIDDLDVFGRHANTDSSKVLKKQRRKADR